MDYPLPGVCHVCGSGSPERCACAHSIRTNPRIRAHTVEVIEASIATYATYLVDPALPHPRELLARIGHKHASLGVTPAEYHVVHENLFAAIVEVLGADTVTAPVTAAWDRVYWLMANTLIDLESELYRAAGVEPGEVFRDVRVVQRIDDAADVAVFVVESADPQQPLPDFLPGQYISVGADLPDGAPAPPVQPGEPLGRTATRVRGAPGDRHRRQPHR